MGIECTRLTWFRPGAQAARGCPPGSLHPQAAIPLSRLGFMGCFSASPFHSL